jgi:hypothetical protein
MSGIWDWFTGGQAGIDQAYQASGAASPYWEDSPASIDQANRSGFGQGFNNAVWNIEAAATKPFLLIAGAAIILLSLMGDRE